MDPTPSDLADMIDNGADLIERGGWWNGCTPEGGIAGTCLMLSVEHGNPTLTFTDYMPALDALVDFLGFDEWADAYRWNDAPGRTKQEVLDLMRACSKDQRARADA